MTFGNSS